MDGKEVIIINETFDERSVQLRTGGIIWYSPSKAPSYLTKVSKNSPSSIGGRWIAEKENGTLVLQCEVWYTIISRKDRKDWLYRQNGS